MRRLRLPCSPRGCRGGGGDGGLRVTEPAADLCAAMALVSALVDKPLPRDCVVFGEISLSGVVL